MLRATSFDSRTHVLWRQDSTPRCLSNVPSVDTPWAQKRVFAACVSETTQSVVGRRGHRAVSSAPHALGKAYDVVGFLDASPAIQMALDSINRAHDGLALGFRASHTGSKR